VANRNELVNSKKAEEFYAIVPDKKKVIKLPRIKKDKVRPVPGCRPVVGLPLLGVVRHLLEFGRRGSVSDYALYSCRRLRLAYRIITYRTGRGRIIQLRGRSHFAAG
jgi:hypothetical protein